MKDIITFINEALEKSVTLNDLEVKFLCPEEIFIQVPESMGESDIQIYLDDTLLGKFPLEAKEDDLKKNKQWLEDVYFEYDSMEASQGTTTKADIPWDDHYDPSLNNTPMNVMKVSHMKYVGFFRKFEMENIDPEDKESVRETIQGLMNGMLDEVKDDIPFEVTIENNEESIHWK